MPLGVFWGTAVPAPSRAFAYSLAAYIAFVVTRAHEVVPFLSAVRPAKISLLVVLVAVAMNPRQLAWQTIARSHVTKFMLLTAALAVMSVPGGIWPGGSAKFILTVYIQTFLVFVLVASGFMHRTMLWLGVKVFAFGALAAAVMSFIVPPGRSGRFGIGTTYDPNDTAAFLVVSLPFFFLLATEGGRIRKIALASVPIVLAAVMRTGSRGGIVALAATVAVLLFYAPPRRRSVYVGLVAICGLVFSATMTDELRQRFLNIFDQTDYNFTDRDGRKAVMLRGIGYMKDNPVLGVGIAGFPYAEGATKRNEGSGIKFTNAHNAYIQAGAELGIPGLICFVGVIVTAVGGCVRVRKRLLATRSDSAGVKREVGLATAAICAMVGVCAAAMFLSTAYSPVTYFMFGLCTAIVLGAPLPGVGAHAVPATPQLAGAAREAATPRPVAARQSPRVRGWVSTARGRQVGPVRWRGGLNR
ncbi:MAG TPA: O-antigen ligase family protein [Gemmatimonadaceae bacterium]|jgi:O-antigen ligase|nr:O-antigen ligase family protein [Gemmatimonadaceae bacterium]